MGRIINVRAIVDAGPCRCGGEPRAEMWGGGSAGAAITCDSCYARLTVLNFDPLEALRIAGIRWNARDYPAGTHELAVGVTARETATDPSKGDVKLGAETPQGRGGAPDEDLSLARTPGQASTPTDAAVPGCARQPDGPVERPDRALDPLSHIQAHAEQQLAGARVAVLEAEMRVSLADEALSEASRTRDSWRHVLAAVAEVRSLMEGK